MLPCISFSLLNINLGNGVNEVQPLIHWHKNNSHASVWRKTSIQCWLIINWKKCTFRSNKKKTSNTYWMECFVSKVLWNVYTVYVFILFNMIGQCTIWPNKVQTRTWEQHCHFITESTQGIVVQYISRIVVPVMVGTAVYLVG